MTNRPICFLLTEDRSWQFWGRTSSNAQTLPSEEVDDKEEQVTPQSATATQYWGQVPWFMEANS